MKMETSSENLVDATCIVPREGGSTPNELGLKVDIPSRGMRPTRAEYQLLVRHRPS